MSDSVFPHRVFPVLPDTLCQDASDRLTMCAARAARMIERRLQDEILLEIVSSHSQRIENDSGPAA